MTKKIRDGLLVMLLLAAAPLCTPRSADAGLGEPADSVENDAKNLSAVRKSATTRNSYTVHEVQSDSGMVREYVSEGGVVFAIAWEGMMHPDLTPLLGSYSGEYAKALKDSERKTGRRRLQLKSDNIVVEKWGHMRHLRGRAYVPALLPAGLKPDDLK